MTLEYVPGEHREPLSRLSALLGDCIHPVPLLQLVGMPYSGKSTLLGSFIKEKDLPHTTLDCSVFSESKNTKSSTLVKWKWSLFVKKLLKSISQVNPEESKLCSRLRSFEITSPNDILSLLLRLTYAENEVEELKKCLVIVLDNYQELLHSEPMLLTYFLRIHERLGSPPGDSPKRLKRKVVIVLVGHYAVPQFLIGSMHIPVINVSALQKESCLEILTAKFRDKALEIAREKLERLLQEDAVDVLEIARLAWTNYVSYLVDVIYQWYRNDFNSLGFYCRFVALSSKCISRLFWPVYLDHVTEDPKRTMEVIAEEKHLASTMDIYIRRITQDYQSRFVNDLRESSMATTKRHKFHGSRLSKYIIIGAAVAAMCDYKNVKRQLKKTTRRPRAPPSAESREPWNSLRNFDTNALISFTEWVMLTNEGTKIKLDSLFYKQLFWVIQEGFIRPVSAANNFRSVAVGKSGLLWQKEQEYSTLTTHTAKQGNQYLIQMTKQNIQLSLIVCPYTQTLKRPFRHPKK
ncbi:hypothetical protein BEWA_026960 [Theileria equi strain WA]|uniref:Uncharacterized protein n=1 Tax=Theileria equi strain WA TaxID=1537102 RepID=L0AW73_THEEQ|nr:hypothetical protein BEWA_026960 [Theileria equi strain WA]AFZ79847.1 hypothetical protein BEWA_026960 [Theileria equi strain WA]|eukprot:XP_004829513.1 hypothetical protein BEWA_026960 [Theileria equi strain WA]